MNLFKKLDILPIDTPRILFAPDSLGSSTFCAFSYENALFSSINLFFVYSSWVFLSFVLNLLINSPMRSVAPSGGFSTFFFPFFLSSFVYSTFFSYFTSETELSEGLID